MRPITNIKQHTAINGKNMNIINMVKLNDSPLNTFWTTPVSQMVNSKYSTSITIPYKQEIDKNIFDYSIQPIIIVNIYYYNNNTLF